MRALHGCLAVLVAVSTLSLLACGAPDDRGPEDVESPGDNSATTSSTPEMCAEHGVLEAVCTICNPKLAVIFQNKGDWCAEHSLPESFCPICHPESGGRPGLAIKVDEAPAHGVRVQLASPEISRRSGIETETSRAVESGIPIVATAMLVADNSRNAEVGPKTPGVIRAFHVRLGETVHAGQVLATVESAAVGDARADLRAARTRLRVAEAQYDRQKELYESGVSPLRSYQQAEEERDAALAAVAMARGTLRMIGADEEGSEGTFALRSPIDGVVTERRHTVGELIADDVSIFEVLDASVLWADIDVPELHAIHVHPGQQVELSVDGLGERTFTGRIDYVAPVIDPQTRTVRARAYFGNEDGALRANTFARVRILVTAEDSGALVPRAALQDAKGVSLVFVPVSTSEFETRRVRTAPSDGDLVQVLSGVLPGEEVVTTGSFLLKTETLKGSIGAGCCEVPGGGN